MRERSKSFISVVALCTVCFPLQAAVAAAGNDHPSALFIPALLGRLVVSQPLQYPEQRLKDGVLPLRYFVTSKNRRQFGIAGRTQVLLEMQPFPTKFGQNEFP
jgi:hypothetical protein